MRRTVVATLSCLCLASGVGAWCSSASAADEPVLNVLFQGESVESRAVEDPREPPGTITRTGVSSWSWWYRGRASDLRLQLARSSGVASVSVVGKGDPRVYKLEDCIASAGLNPSPPLRAGLFNRAAPQGGGSALFGSAPTTADPRYDNLAFTGYSGAEPWCRNWEFATFCASDERYKGAGLLQPWVPFNPSRPRDADVKWEPDTCIKPFASGAGMGIERLSITARLHVAAADTRLRDVGFFGWPVFWAAGGWAVENIQAFVLGKPRPHIFPEEALREPRPPEDGILNESVFSEPSLQFRAAAPAKVLIATAKVTFKKGKVAKSNLAYTAAGRQLLRTLSSPARLTVALRSNPKRGNSRSDELHYTIVPRPS